MSIQQCSICGTTPTLYIANGRQFCKAHKADAEALLWKSVGPIGNGKARNSTTGNTEYQDDRRKHKKDHNRARSVIR